jgi:hypothetical protein
VFVYCLLERWTLKTLTASGFETFMPTQLFSSKRDRLAAHIITHDYLSELFQSELLGEARAALVMN